MILADVVLVIMLVLAVVLVAVAVAGFVSAHYAITDSLGRSILETWARSTGLEFIRVERRRWRQSTPFNRRGPLFTRWGSGDRVIYRVLVRTERSKPRAGWVRCGHWLWGLFIVHADVVWDPDDAKLVLKSPKEPASAPAGPLWDREID